MWEEVEIQDWLVHFLVREVAGVGIAEWRGQAICWYKLLAVVAVVVEASVLQAVARAERVAEVVVWMEPTASSLLMVQVVRKVGAEPGGQLPVLMARLIQAELAVTLEVLQVVLTEEERAAMLLVTMVVVVEVEPDIMVVEEEVMTQSARAREVEVEAVLQLARQRELHSLLVQEPLRVIPVTPTI
jgi:hypothetical protein